MDPVNSTDAPPIDAEATCVAYLKSPIGEGHMTEVHIIKDFTDGHPTLSESPDIDCLKSPIGKRNVKNVVLKSYLTVNNAQVDRVLCIDGGGVKGVVEGTILKYLHFCFQRHHAGDADNVEADLKSFIQGDCDNINGKIIKTWNYDAEAEPEIYRMFDLIAGTSTGSIIASAIARLHWNPDQIITAAQEIAELVFPKPSNWNLYGRMKSSILSVASLLSNYFSKYSADAIEKYLMDKLKDSKWDQKDSKYGDRQDPTLGILCTNYETSQIHIYDSRKYKESKVTIRDAVRASTAAPTYFLPKIIKDDLFHEDIVKNHDTYSKDSKEYTFIDGGLAANVPANYVMHMVSTENILGVLLSIGCGDGVPSTQPIKRIFHAAMNNEGQWTCFLKSHPHERNRLFRIIPCKETKIGDYNLADSDKVEEMRKVYIKTLLRCDLNDFIKPTEFIFAKSLKIKEVEVKLKDQKTQLYYYKLVIESRYNKEIFVYEASIKKNKDPVRIELRRKKPLKPILLMFVWNEQRDDFTLTYRDIEIIGSPIRIRVMLSDNHFESSMEPNTPKKPVLI